MYSAERLFHEWKALSTSIANRIVVANIFDSIISVVFWMCFFFAALIILGASFTEIMVPLGTVVVSTSFAFASSIQMVR